MANGTSKHVRMRPGFANSDTPKQALRHNGGPVELKVTYFQGSGDFAASWVQNHCPGGVRITHSRFGPTQGRITLQGGASDIKSFAAKLLNQRSVTSVERT